LASFLPSKTIPLTAAGNTGKRVLKPKSTKRKAKSALKEPSKKLRVATQATDDLNNTTTLTPTTTEADAASTSLAKDSSPELVASHVRQPYLDCLHHFCVHCFSIQVSQMKGKKNYIYLFYECVTTNDKGESRPGDKYYRCFHGQRKTYTVSPTMKHSTKSKHRLQLYLLIYVV
jgi:hypothetical protein